jgi:RNA methyltransferase, TrmH family
MPVRIIESRQNARLKALRQALAKPPRANEELAGIEGPNLIDEALRAGVGIKTVFVAQEAARLVDELNLPRETEVLLVPRALLNESLTTETPQPIAALVLAPRWEWADLLASRGKTAPLVVVLAGLQDPGNLGTILRSAEAFGATGVVSLPGTVSVWNPKAARASAGSVFRLPVVEATVEECFAKLHHGGVRVLTTAVAGAEEAPSVNLAGPVALLIGNEGSGVPAELAGNADGALTIPCPGPVESLNAAVAASVLLYEASQQRAAAKKGSAR